MLGQPSVSPTPADLLCSFEGDSSILQLERDSQSLELQCYQDTSTPTRQSTASKATMEPKVPQPRHPTSTSNVIATGSSTEPSISTVAMANATPASKRGCNWSALDRVCFISALDNHNPWIATNSQEALAAWQDAIEETNRALAHHKRETRNEGAFEAQWKKLLKEVRERKTRSLKATGANFNVEEAYATLYNLVDLYNASSIKLSFLKTMELPPSITLSSQLERVQRQKQKQAVSLAREAGQTGQTLALQRL